MKSSILFLFVLLPLVSLSVTSSAFVMQQPLSSPLSSSFHPSSIRRTTLSSSSSLSTITTRTTISTPTSTTTLLRTTSLDGNTNSNNVDPTMKEKEDIIMSQAIPVLECPDILKDCTYAGNYGFDPLHFAVTTDDLIHYREAEIRHARLAMLGAIGWPLSELYDRQIAELLGLPTVVDMKNHMTIIDEIQLLERISPVFWGFCLGCTMAIEDYAMSKAAAAKSANNNYYKNYIPGDLNFDPLNLYPKINESGKLRMQLAEIKHGRLAMIAIIGFAVQEYVTHLAVIDETSSLFLF